MRSFKGNGQPKRKLNLKNYRRFPSYVQEYIDIYNKNNNINLNNSSQMLYNNKNINSTNFYNNTKNYLFTF